MRRSVLQERNQLLVQLQEMAWRQMLEGMTPSIQPHHGLIYPLAPDFLVHMTQAFAKGVQKVQPPAPCRSHGDPGPRSLRAADCPSPYARSPPAPPPPRWWTA